MPNIRQWQHDAENETKTKFYYEKYESNRNLVANKTHNIDSEKGKEKKQ